jgi:hypothetical protein
MAMTNWNFIGQWGSQCTGPATGVVAENNVNAFQRLTVKLMVRTKNREKRDRSFV